MIKSIAKNVYKALKPGRADSTNPPKKATENYPPDFSEEEINIIEQVKEFTMTTNERLVSLIRAVEYIHANAIPGDIVECGVWRGGSTMSALLTLLRLNEQHRRAFLFDTFEGMPPPGEEDKRYDEQAADDLLKKNEISDNDGRNIWCFATLDDVRQNLRSTLYPSELIHFVQGKVEDTLPHDAIETISLLRLDTDWYESTKHELETLFDKVSVGGVIIIDDYGHWQGCKKAVDEFITSRKCKLFLNRIDYTGRLGIKISK